MTTKPNTDSQTIDDSGLHAPTCSASLDSLSLLEWRQWAFEICSDFKIEYDPHDVGLRSAITKRLAYFKSEILKACLREQSAIDDYKLQKERADEALLSQSEQKQIWQPIETLDRTQMQFVLVTEDGAVRLHLWNPRGYWERAFPIGSIVDNGDCENPTHWMPLPIPPNTKDIGA